MSDPFLAWFSADKVAAIGQPIVNRLGCRWHGLEKATPHLQISRSSEFLRADPPVPPPTRDEFERYGPDASIALWMIASWAVTQSTLYPHELFLMDLDIHTLPPIPVDLVRGQFKLNLARVSVKGVPAVLMDRVGSLTINDCRELEWIAPVPERLFQNLSIASCPKLEMRKFRDARETRGFEPQLFFSLYGGNEAMRQAQWPRCLAVIEQINEHMRIVERCRLINSCRQELVAEAFKPARIERRINEYDFDAVMESMAL